MTLNTLRNEHLDPNEKPLYVSLDHIQEEVVQKIFYFLGFGRGVDWYSSPFVNKLLNNRNPEKDSYVISEVSEENKHSRKYYDCTGVVLVGKNSKGKNISLLTHQDPKYLFCRKDSLECQMRFKKDLGVAIESFKVQAVPGTIDACILGGNYICCEIDYHGVSFNLRKNYIDSIELLNQIITQSLGFSPVVIGPIFDAGYSDIFLDTKNRRVIQRRREKEDFTFLENIIFQAKDLQDTLAELNSKSTIKKIPLRYLLK